MNESLSWVAAGLFGIFFAGNGLTRSFEASAARDLKSRLQGQPSVRISTRTNLASLWGDMPSVKIVAAHFSTEGLPLYTEPNRSTRGKVHRFEMHLSDFTLNGLHIDQLDASIPNCRYDFGLAARNPPQPKLHRKRHRPGPRRRPRHVPNPKISRNQNRDGPHPRWLHRRRWSRRIHHPDHQLPRPSQTRNSKRYPTRPARPHHRVRRSPRRPGCILRPPRSAQPHRRSGRRSWPSRRDQA